METETARIFSRRARRRALFPNMESPSLARTTTASRGGRRPGGDYSTQESARSSGPQISASVYDIADRRVWSHAGRRSDLELLQQRNPSATSETPKRLSPAPSMDADRLRGGLGRQVSPPSDPDNPHRPVASPRPVNNNDGMKLAVIAFATLLAAAWIAPSATAAAPTVTVTGTVLNIVGTPGSDELELMCSSGQIRVNGALPSAGNPSCTLITDIVEHLGEGHDNAYWWDDAGFNSLLNVSIFGDAGNDYLVASEDDYLLDGGEGNDLIRVNNTGSVVVGGPGIDTITAAGDFNMLLTASSFAMGGEEMATFDATTEQAALYIYLLWDFDTQVDAQTFPGQVMVRGGPGNNTILTGPGNDTVFGGLGNDTIDGGAGDDVLRGEDNDDQLFGKDGNDRLNGGRDSDVCVGGTGKNQLRSC